MAVSQVRQEEGIGRNDPPGGLAHALGCLLVLAAKPQRRRLVAGR